MTTTDVLIVGAGPAGLGLALVLLENGVKVRIVDKMSAIRLGSRGNGIMPRMLEILKFLGVLDHVFAESVMDLVVQPYKGPGGMEKLPLQRPFPQQPQTPATPYPNGVALGQELLEGILIQAILDRFGVQVEYGTELLSIESSDDEVIAHLQRTAIDGTIHPETTKGKYLVGADGGRSRVRKELGLAFDGDALPGTMVVADIRVIGLEPTAAHTWSDPVKGRVAFFPASRRPNHPFALRIMLPPGTTTDADVMVQDPEAVKRLVMDIIERKDIELGDFTYLTVYRAHARMVDSFSNGGRVFLAGDAAHCHSPMGSQGLNSSMQDSLNLGWKLAAAVHGCAAPALLESYNSERVPVIASMLNRTTTAFMNMRDTATTGEKGIPRFDKDLNQLGIHYAWSPIIIDDLEQETELDATKKEVDAYTAGAELHAGHRAPNATGLVSVQGDKGTSLFDLFTVSSHLGVVFVHKDADVHDISSMLGALDAIGGTLVRTILVYAEKPSVTAQGTAQAFVDQDGHAFAAYRPERYGVVGAAIIRPDGVVGAMVRNPKSMGSYFGKIYA